MSKFASAFKKAKESKPIGDFAPPIGLGRHRVGLKIIRGKQSQKNKQIHIETEVVILESATERVGATRGWPWFVNAPEWTGEYASARLKEFMTAIGESVESDQDVEELGDALVYDEDTKANHAHGIVLDVEVSEVMDKADPTKVLRRKGGQPVHNATWFPITQGEEDIEKAKIKMAELEASVATAKPSKAPAETSSASQPALTKSGGIKKLLGK